VNDSDFNDFTSFEYGKTYEIYNKTGSDKSLTVSGKSKSNDISHSIVSGDNFISPAVTTATNVTTVLSSLTYGTDYSDVKRFNATTQTWESYASSQFTQFEAGKGYNIVGLRSTSFSYGKTETTTTFVYDSAGARVKKTAGNSTTIYLGKDYDIQSSLTSKYIFLGDRRINVKKSDGTLEFIHDDHISSSNVVTDASGNQAGLYEYDPYGRTVTHTGTADLKHKFTGQEEDDSTGLYYYGARYYDPQIGRFVTPDWYVQAPGDPQSFNRYAYARNNPIRYTDPTGNFWFVAAIIGAIIGAVSAGIQSGGDFKSILAGAGIGFLAGAAGGVAGSAVHGGFFGAIVGGAVGGSVAGGLNAAYYGGDVGQGILRGAGFGALGGLAYGGINAGFDKFVTAPNFRWEMVRVALEGAAGGGLSQLSGGEFWEGVAFSSAIAGSRFLYRVSIALRNKNNVRDPFLTSSTGKGDIKPDGQDVWLPDSADGKGKNNVGFAVYKDKAPNSFSETSPAMEALSLFPGANGTAYAHDQWMGGISGALGSSRVGATLRTMANVATLPVAAGLNYAGSLHEPSQMALYEVYGDRDRD